MQFLFWVNYSFSQVPKIEWQKCIGTNSYEYIESGCKTKDGGIIIAGFSDDNYKSNNALIIKLNEFGIIEWQKSYGSKGNDRANGIIQTSDGGFVFIGTTDSDDGQLENNHGSSDYWIVKITSMGNIEWQKCYGGSGTDEAYSVVETINGDYIIIGKSGSEDGNISINKGKDDVWIIKLDSIGKMLWQKSIGGEYDDEASSIQNTLDTGFIIAGFSASDDGDVNCPSDTYVDAWIVKMNNLGEIQWSKCIGGYNGDDAKCIQQTSDEGFVFTGRTVKNKNYDGFPNFDVFVVKIDKNGFIEWEKIFGGSKWEEGNSIKQTKDGGYIIGGFSSSNNGDLSKNQGCNDFWIIKIDSMGNIEWEKSLGGSGYEEAKSIILTSDGGYIVAGVTDSNDGDVKGFHGEKDAWIVKLK